MQMLATIAAILPWWEYLRLSDILRLTRCSKDLYDGVIPQLLEWLSVHVCPCTWRRVACNPKGGRVVRRKPTASPSFARMKDIVLFDESGRFYAPKPPTNDAVWRNLHTRLCRECLAPTLRKARTKTGRIVMVCKACATDPDSASSMCDRRELIQLNGGSRRGYNALISSLHVCKIGGNRAILYWRSDVLQALYNR